MEKSARSATPRSRSTAPRRSRTSGTAQHYRTRGKVEKSSDYRETMLMQCIVCGILLACALVICLVNVPATQAVRGNLKQAIGNSNGLEEVTDLWASLGEIKNSVQVIFGQTQEDGGALEQAEKVSVPVDLSEPSVKPASTDERIDEDILSTINSKQDFYGESIKKQTVLLSN